MLLQQKRPPVYRLRATMTEDAYGDPVLSWDPPARSLLKGAYIQAVSSIEEESVTRRIMRGEKLLFVPGVADLTEDDRIEQDSEIWRVNGAPEVRRGLASAAFTTAVLARVEG